MSRAALAGAGSLRCLRESCASGKRAAAAVVGLNLETPAIRLAGRVFKLLIRGFYFSTATTTADCRTQLHYYYYFKTFAVNKSNHCEELLARSGAGSGGGGIGRADTVVWREIPAAL